MRKVRIFCTVAILLALVTGFGGGTWYERERTVQNADSIVRTVIGQDDGISRAVDFGLFWQVWDRLHQQHVDRDKLDAQALVYGAISGMVDAAGDPYTVFMPPADTKEFQEEVSGSFSGVGMEVGKRDGVLVVIAPLKDTPAFRAGIKAGDAILKIDNEDTDGWTVEQAVNRIRGKRGTTVHLTLFREGETEVRELDIVRDTIRVPAVEWRMLDGKVAYIQLSTFNGNLEGDFAAAARAAADQGAAGIILDLRDNPGGLLDGAVSVAGWFLPADSLVVTERFNDGTTDEMRTGGAGRLGSLPTVVIINGGSASASEILAGALHDLRDIRIVGEQSYGKGSVQQLEGFYNGSSLKVTVAKWFTPAGISISDTGIAPTDEVIMDPADAETQGWEIGTPGKDPQLDRAIEILGGAR